MGTHYDRTLMNWRHRFEDAWPRFRDQYGDRFFRMFRYHMLSFAGAVTGRAGNSYLDARRQFLIFRRAGRSR